MLINTKLKAPPLRSSLLYRQELIKRLRAAEGFPIIQILGPAGSGKTTLTSQWINAASISAAWYSLDKEDNDPDLFFRYLLTVFTYVDKGLNASFGPLLNNRHRLTSELAIPHIIESFSGKGQQILLIMDDFHHIKDENILNAFPRLIQQRPTRLKFVILSRYSLPTSMAMVIPEKDHFDITASDLKFTEEESTAFFKKVVPGRFSPDQIENLSRYFEGWAAGLQLAGLSASSKNHGDDLSYILNKTHEKVASYLIYDILQIQSEKIRNFITATTLLDRFNPELCTEVTGRNDAAEMLAHIEQLNLFLITLDSKQKWYRYHHTFSEVVRQRTIQHNPDLIAITLRKAASWFAANNHLEDALRCAFRSEDYEFAADLMENYITLYTTQMNPSTGLRWILRLPPETLNQRMLLKLHQCNFLLMLTEFAELKEILMAIENKISTSLEEYSEKKRTLCEDFYIYLKCMLQILHTDHPADIIQYKALSEKISPQNQYFLIGLEYLFVSAFIYGGEFAQAEASLSKASKMLAAHNITTDNVYHIHAKAFMARHQGQLNQGKSIICKELQRLEQTGYKDSFLTYFLCRNLGHIFYLQNRLSEARECVALAYRYSKYVWLNEEILQGDDLQLLLHLADGEKDKAFERIQQMRIYSLKTGIAKIGACADAWAARIALEQKNLTLALLWSQRRNIKMDEPFSMLFTMECMTLASLYYFKKQYSEADCLLQVLRKRCLKRELLELVLHIDIMHCAVFYAMDQRPKAVMLMKNALAFSETDGYIRPYVNYSVLIAPILKRLTEELPDTSPGDHLKQIVAACDITLAGQSTSPKAQNAGPEDLTLREIEILEWVSKGLKNKEIAQKTFISVNTVKTHVSSIIAKLNVRTRTQAIIKARKFGILK